MEKQLNDIIINYIDLKSSTLKPSTIARYKNLYINHIKHNFDNEILSTITNSTLQAYVDYLVKNNISSHVIKDAITLIKLSLKHEAKYGDFIMPYLDLDIPLKKRKHNVSILNKHEQKQLITYVLDNEPLKYSGVVLSLFTGMRIGEICALKWSDVDLKKRQIDVHKTLQRICTKGSKSLIDIGQTKTINGCRTIPISNFLYNFLVSIKPSNRNTYYLTGTNIYKEPRNYRKIFETLLKKLNIKNITFHSLRHTFATRLIENKVDIKTVSELLGHSSTNITISIYVHSEYSTKKKAVKTLDKLILK